MPKNRVIRKLRKPLFRRIGKLTVEVSEEGVAIRGFKKHLWRRFTWAQIATLDAGGLPAIRQAEEVAGSSILKLMGSSD